MWWGVGVPPHHVSCSHILSTGQRSGLKKHNLLIFNLIFKEIRLIDIWAPWNLLSAADLKKKSSTLHILRHEYFDKKSVQKGASLYKR